MNLARWAGWVDQTTWKDGNVVPKWRRRGGVIPEAIQIVVQRSAAKAAAKVKVDPAIIPGKLNLNLLRTALEPNRRPRDGLILRRTFVDEHIHP